MARRRRKAKRRRSKPAMINILNLSESYLLASAGTNLLFGTTAAKFLTEGWLTDKTPREQLGAGHSQTFSLAELVSEVMGTTTQGADWRAAGGVGYAVKTNIERNWPMSLATMIFVPIGFKVGKKMLGKPIRATNRLLKQTTGNAVKI